MSKLRKNLGYQTIYQILSTCLPLITAPYLARVFGAELQGIASYTQSIANYFTLFALLGVINYGTRTIAADINDNKKISKDFWSIYLFQCFSSLLCILIYVLYIQFVCKENVLIAALQGISIVACLFDINWFFFGLEEFKITVTRNIFIRIFTVALILIFVKGHDDLWLYVLIMSGGTFASNLILWKYIKNRISFEELKHIKFADIKKHVKPNIVLFIPLLAVTVYHVMDKTMLGALSTYTETGYYYNADKVINIPIGIISGIGTVMLPRMSYLVSTEKRDSFEKTFNLSSELVIALSCSMAFGISAISKEFTPIFFGDGFGPCVLLIIMLSPVLIFKGLSQTVRMQYLIPMHKENIYIESVFIGAIVNLIVNLSLIPLWGAKGAVIGTVIAEFTSCVWQYYKMKKYVNIWQPLIRGVFYVASGVVMYIIVRCVSAIGTHNILGLLIEICVGTIVYIILCFCFWIKTKNPIVMPYLYKLVSKVGKRKDD